MKFVDELISVYAFFQSFLFLMLAFFAAFLSFLIDISSTISLFLFPITFGILFFYSGYGIWERKKWGYYIGIVSFISIGIAEIIGIQNSMGLAFGILHLILGFYLIYDILVLEKI